jgi:hypothetical protein
MNTWSCLPRPCGTSAALQAQGYLLRLDARMQSVSYRGVKLDSIPGSAVDTASNGSLFTPDGYSAYCPVGQAHCEYYRAGPSINSAPLMTSADLTVWGIGLPGLSLHANARAGGIGLVCLALGLSRGFSSRYAKYQRQGFTGRLGHGPDGGWAIPASTAQRSATAPTRAR